MLSVSEASRPVTLEYQRSIVNKVQFPENTLTLAELCKIFHGTLI